MEGIPFRDLPKSFQDAVLVVQHFQIKYLWIDSLCIIQDSVQDWEFQCPRMAGIYSKALFTIAAADARDDSEGFLGSFEFSRRCDLGKKVSVRYVRNDDNLFLLDEFLFSDEHCRLSERGWALQEKLLSQRVLVFKSDRLQWQCNKFYRSDDIQFPYQPHPCVSDNAVKKRVNEINDHASAHHYWRQIIADYSRRHLTRSQDKLPALSGLASEFLKRDGDTYLAGLWKDDILFSLCWIARSETGEREDERSPTSDFRAPSWSWASCDHEISYECLPRYSWTPDLEVVSAHTALRGSDQFGRVDDGQIYAKGRIAKIPFSPHILSKLLSTGSAAVPSIGLLFFDSPKLVPNVLLGNDQDVVITTLCVLYSDIIADGIGVVTNLREMSVEERQIETNICRPWMGLILEIAPTDSGEESYRRIGCVSGEDRRERLVKGWFDDCERRLIKLI